MGRLSELSHSTSLDMEVFNYGPVVIFKWRNEPGWPIEFVSGNVGINLGYSVESFMNSEVVYEDIIHPLDVKLIRNAVKEHIEKNLLTMHHEPYRLITGKGEIRWVSDYTILNRDSDGKVVSFIGYIFDITDQMKKEKTLTEYMDRFLHLLEVTKEGVWDWDMRTDEVFYSKRWKQMLGFEEHEVHESLLEWEKRVHKDDLQKCYEDIESHLKGEAELYENIHRMMNKAGEYIWILARGIKILDDHGNPYRIIGTNKDITEEREMNEKLIRMTLEDSLTGLLNRRAYYNIMPRELAECIRYNNKLSLIMLDIDFFKKVNDTWGHSFGDVVLRRLSELTKEYVRTTDYVFRLGGEEFAILLTQTDATGAHELAERLRVRISEEAFSPAENETMTITVSMGISEYKEDMRIDEFTESSDKALYEAKRTGRNKVVIYDHETLKDQKKTKQKD